MRVAILIGFAGVLANQVEGTLQWLILLAAAATAVGVLHVKVMVPAVRFTGKVARGVDILLELPQRHGDIERRLSDIEQTIGGRNGHRARH